MEFSAWTFDICVGTVRLGPITVTNKIDITARIISNYFITLFPQAESSARQQVTIPANSSGVYIIFKGIVTRTTEMVGIAQVKLEVGACTVEKQENLNCTANTFECQDKCLPITEKCNGKVNCFGGIDEKNDQCGK